MDNSIKDTMAEQAILGSIILKNSLLENIELSIDEFYHEANKLIYGAILTMFNTGKTIDLVTLQDSLNKQNKLETVGGLRYLMQLTNNSSVIATVFKEHVDIVKKKAQLRKIYTATVQAMKMCQSGCDPNDVMQSLATLNVDAGDKKAILNIFDIFKANTLEIEKKASAEYGGIPTKIIGLDRILGGLQNSDLIVLAARPAMGKTALALNIATNIAVHQDRYVLIFSLEMSAGQLVNRVVASLQGIEGTHLLRPKQLTEEEWQKYWSVVNVIEGKHLDVYDSGNVSPATVRKVMRQYKAKGHLDVVIIDYLQLMQADGKYNGNKVLEVGEITRALKLLAREFNVPIILLSQLNRSVDSRQDKNPVLADLRDSGTIEQDADIVLFLYREGYYNPDCENPNVTNLKVAKHRSGALGNIDLFFDGETTTFHDMIDEQ